MPKLSPPIVNTSTESPYERMKCYENSMEILLEWGLLKKGEDGKGTFLKHPDSSNNRSVHVFFDSGLVHVWTDKLEPLETDNTYTTIHLMEQLLEVEPMVYGRQKGWIPKAKTIASPTQGSVDGGLIGAVSNRMSGTSVKAAVEIHNYKKDLEEWVDTGDEPDLFDGLIYESATTFLFGNTGIGKSILAFEIGIAIAGGWEFVPFKIPNPSPVLYLNFELTQKQVMRRYSSGDKKRKFPENFDGIYRSSANAEWDGKGFFSYVQQALDALPRTKVVILDNLTYVFDDAGNVAEGGIFLKKFQALITERNIAALIVNHTTKISDERFMSENDMQGSFKLKSFADVIFGIMESQTEPNTVLLKEFKQRDIEKRFIGDNLIKFRREKAPFLTLRHDGFDSEKNHRTKHKKAPGEATIKRELKKEIAIKANGLGLEMEVTLELLDIKRRTYFYYLNGGLPSKPQK